MLALINKTSKFKIIIRHFKGYASYEFFKIITGTNVNNSVLWRLRSSTRSLLRLTVVLDLRVGGKISRTLHKHQQCVIE